MGDSANTIQQTFKQKSKIEREFQENSEKTLKFDILLRNHRFLRFLGDSAVLKTPLSIQAKIKNCERIPREL